MQQIQIVFYDNVYNICTDNDSVIILAIMYSQSGLLLFIYHYHGCRSSERGAAAVAAAASLCSFCDMTVSPGQ